MARNKNCIRMTAEKKKERRELFALYRALIHDLVKQNKPTYVQLDVVSRKKSMRFPGGVPSIPDGSIELRQAIDEELPMIRVPAAESGVYKTTVALCEEGVFSLLPGQRYAVLPNDFIPTRTKNSSAVYMFQATPAYEKLVERLCDTGRVVWDQYKENDLGIAATDDLRDCHYRCSYPMPEKVSLLRTNKRIYNYWCKSVFQIKLFANINDIYQLYDLMSGGRLPYTLSENGVVPLRSIGHNYSHPWNFATEDISYDGEEQTENTEELRQFARNLEALTVIWKAALEKQGEGSPHPALNDIDYVADLYRREEVADVVEELAHELGIEAMIDLYREGVPVQDIIS